MKYFSMFSGIGTGEQGIEQAFGGKAECIGFSEIDRHAEAIYKFHRPDHRNYGDATKLIPSELPDFDFLIGGFPCQAFSIAGKRLGFEDTRGTLFFEIARVLREKRPSHFLLENVAGLLSHDNGSTFRTIVSALDEIGYDLEWTVINSKDHGVPQNRERVFIIGHPRNGSCGKVFSFGEGDEESFGEQDGERHDIAHTITNSDKQRGSYVVAQGVNHPSRGVEVRKDGLAATLKSGESGTQRPKVAIGTLRTHKDGEGFREMKSNVAPALNARARQDGSQQAVIQINPSTESGGKQPYQQNRIYDENGIAPALNAQLSTGSYAVASRGRYNENGEIEQNLEPRHDGLTNTITSVEKDNLVANQTTIRRLTPIECERLQGCPASYTKFGRYGDEVKEVADTNRYKGLGNAFTVNVIEAIITRMIEMECLN